MLHLAFCLETPTWPLIMSNTIEYINILAIIIFLRRQGGSIAEHYIAIVVVVVVVYIGDRETNTVC